MTESGVSLKYFTDNIFDLAKVGLPLYLDNPSGAGVNAAKTEKVAPVDPVANISGRPTDGNFYVGGMAINKTAALVVVVALVAVVAVKVIR